MINGKLFCITGGLGNFPLKKDAYEEILHHGGDTTDKITNACDFLILGAKGNPNYAQGKRGNKQLKAEAWAAKGYPIKVISENQFIALLESTEELSEEAWGKNLIGLNAPSPGIERNTRDGLEISSSFWIPKESIHQVLRIEFTTGETDKSIIDNWHKPLQKIKAILSSYDMKNLIRTELIPAGWARDDSSRFLPDRFLLTCRIIALLDTAERKERAHEIIEDATRLLIEHNMEGKLSLRIWDESYRYGKYWINKLV